MKIYQHSSHLIYLSIYFTDKFGKIKKRYLVNTYSRPAETQDLRISNNLEDNFDTFASPLVTILNSEISKFFPENAQQKSVGVCVKK